MHTDTIETKAIFSQADHHLRVGIVKESRLVADRRIPFGDDVTVGPDADATFQLPTEAREQFVCCSDGYHLVHDRRMSGRIYMGGAVLTLDQLADGDGVQTVHLGTSDRGKVQVGDATVLFQFVSAQPKPTPDHLDYSPVGQIDWAFWGFVIFSFVVNIAGYAYIQTRPAMPPVVSIEAIPERMVEGGYMPKEVLDAYLKSLDIPTDEPVNETLPPVEVPAHMVPGAQQDDAVADNEGGEGTATDDGEAGVGGGLDREAQVAAARERLMGQGLPGVMAGVGGVETLLGHDDLEGQIDRSLNGVREHDAAGRQVAGGLRHVTQPGQAGTIGEHGGFTVGDAGQVGRQQQAVVADLELEEPVLDTGADDGSISALLKRNSRRIKAAYERQLKSDPELHGRVEVTVTVAADGTVLSARVTENTTGSGTLGSSIARCIDKWDFPATGEEYEVAIPINLFPG